MQSFLGGSGHRLSADYLSGPRRGAVRLLDGRLDKLELSHPHLRLPAPAPSPCRILGRGSRRSGERSLRLMPVHTAQPGQTDLGGVGKALHGGAQSSLCILHSLSQAQEICQGQPSLLAFRKKFRSFLQHFLRFVHRLLLVVEPRKFQAVIEHSRLLFDELTQYLLGSFCIVSLTEHCLEII